MGPWSDSMIIMRPVDGWMAMRRGVYVSGKRTWWKTSPTRSSEIMLHMRRRGEVGKGAGGGAGYGGDEKGRTTAMGSPCISCPTFQNTGKNALASHAGSRLRSVAVIRG